MRIVRYYTTEAVAELKERAQSRLTWYRAGGTGDIELNAVNPVRETRIEMGSLSGGLRTRGKAAKHDAQNAMTVYQALSRLTPHQAADERLWTYMCHMACPDYVARRWLADRPGENSETRMLQQVRNHFFVVGNRGLIRDNALSRLWWLASIALEVDRAEPERFLEILLFRQDPRSALIERPSVSRNMRVLKAVYAVMRKDFATRERDLFVRDVFRAWMKGLNSRGGMVLLDALSDSQLERLVKVEAERALRR